MVLRPPEGHQLLSFAFVASHFLASLRETTNPTTYITMKAVAVLLALVAAANAGVLAPAVVAPTVISRAPAFDSAVIRSDRLGGNFAYSVAESHAYAAHTPVVQQVVSPVAVSYSAGAPVLTAGPGVVAYSGLYGAGPAVVRVA